MSAEVWRVDEQQVQSAEERGLAGAPARLSEVLNARRGVEVRPSDGPAYQETQSPERSESRRSAARNLSLGADHRGILIEEGGVRFPSRIKTHTHTVDLLEMQNNKRKAHDTN